MISVRYGSTASQRAVAVSRAIPAAISCTESAISAGIDGSRAGGCSSRRSPRRRRRDGRARAWHRERRTSVVSIRRPYDTAIAASATARRPDRPSGTRTQCHLARGCATMPFHALRLRFAPSPTGPLHLGSAVVAVANALAARALGGELLLRIDDTDAGRSVEGAEEGILADLAWLGLEFAGEPVRQSERRDQHLAAAASCSRRRTPTAASARPRRSATAGAVARSRAPTPSGATTPASRTSSASACRAPRSSWRMRPAGRALRRRTRSPTSCSCARMGGRRSTSPRRSTTGISRSRTSCAARIISPTPPGTCCCCARSAPSSPSSPTARSSSAPMASGSRPAAEPSRSRACARAASRPRPWSRLRRSWHAPRRAARRGRVVRRARARFSLARLGRGTAHADPAHLAWLGRELLAGLPAEELARRLSRVPARRDRQCVLMALAEAARGASTLGEVADAAAASRAEAGRTTAEPLRSGCFATCVRPTSASTCLRGGGRAHRPPARRAADPRPLGPRRATPSETRPHGHAARPAAPGRGRGAPA